MSMATAVPGRRDETEIYRCTEAELVKSYKAYVRRNDGCVLARSSARDAQVTLVFNVL